MSMFNTKTPQRRDASPSMVAKKTIEKNGQVVKEEEFISDEFAELSKKNGNASISCSVTKGVDFNSEKVTFFVSVKCDQDEKTMDLAAEKVFRKAMGYVNDAGEVLGWSKPA